MATRRYAVERIDGFPPMKDGANSMWGDDGQFPRICKLRHAFLAALGDAPPLSANIRLVLRVHVGPANSSNVGDLDNYITGICDALQAGKSPQSGWWPAWGVADCEAIHPQKAVAITNDRHVVAIDAQKIIGPGEPWYSLELSGD